jgi:hypothetical protein
MLRLIVIAVCVLGIIISYDRSNCMIAWIEFDLSLLWESRNVISRFLWWKSQLSFQGTICSTTLFIFNNKCFRFLPYPRIRHSCKHLSNFVNRSVGLDDWLLVRMPLIFIVTSYIRYNTLYCYEGHSFLSESMSSSWIMDFPNLIEAGKFYYSRIREDINVNISISSGKSNLCSLWIIYNTLLFVVLRTSFRFLLYTMATYLCKGPVRFSLFGSRDLERQLFIILTLVFTFTSYVRAAIFSCCYWYWFRSKSLSFSWFMDIPNWLLNSIDRITCESQNVDIRQWIDNQSCWDIRINGVASE